MYLHRLYTLALGPFLARALYIQPRIPTPFRHVTINFDTDSSLTGSLVALHQPLDDEGASQPLQFQGWNLYSTSAPSESLDIPARSPPNIAARFSQLRLMDHSVVPESQISSQAKIILDPDDAAFNSFAISVMYLACVLYDPPTATFIPVQANLRFTAIQPDNHENFVFDFDYTPESIEQPVGSSAFQKIEFPGISMGSWEAVLRMIELNIEIVSIGRNITEAIVGLLVDDIGALVYHA